MRGVLAHHVRRLDRRMREKPGIVAEQAAIERPAVLGVGGRMHADPAAAAFDVGLQRRLLGGVEHIAGGVEEQHDVVAGQRGGGESGGVFGGRHRHAVARGELLQHGVRGGDGIVAKAGRLAESQHAQRLGRDGGRQRQQHQAGRGGSGRHARQPSLSCPAIA